VCRPNTKSFISIIIPVYNEEEFIVGVLKAISDHPPAPNYEVIVVDNASTDQTPHLVKEYGARLVCYEEGTIAAVRNFGVSESRAQILVFLDADVIVTDEWAKSMPSVIEELLANPMVVTGSRCLPPDNGNWFNSYWFARLAHYDAPYINSGHLIVNRKLFDKIGGFSEHLTTAEDYDFCMKAVKSGGLLKNNPELPVIHLGYPQTIKSFVARERWHGREDFETWASFANSKVGWAAAFNLLLFIAVFLSVMLTVSITPLVSYFFVMAAASFLLTLYKFKTFKSGILQTSIIFYVYLCGRSLALIDRFFGLGNKR